MRILLYTGKGGTGKTTAAATLRAAELDYRTVVVSTDAAHSLADVSELMAAVCPASTAW